MDNLIAFIFGGSSGLTPEMLVRYMAFVIIISAICSISRDALSVGR